MATLRGHVGGARSVRRVRFLGRVHGSSVAMPSSRALSAACVRNARCSLRTTLLRCDCTVRSLITSDGERHRPLTRSRDHGSREYGAPRLLPSVRRLPQGEEHPLEQGPPGDVPVSSGRARARVGPRALDRVGPGPGHWPRNLRRPAASGPSLPGTGGSVTRGARTHGRPPAADPPGRRRPDARPRLTVGGLSPPSRHAGPESRFRRGGRRRRRLTPPVRGTATPPSAPEREEPSCAPRSESSGRGPRG